MSPQRPDITVSRAGSLSSSDDLAPSRWTAVVLHSPAGELVGRRFDLGKKLRFGRVAGDADVEIDDPRLSRAHAAIERAGMIYEVHDLASRNGTFVNGERVQRRGLGAGDVIRVGDTLLEVGPAAAHPHPGDPNLVGVAPALLAALALADRVARSDLAVLLLGETGTGKDVLARRIHMQSGRPGAFVAVNCAALPRDLAEATLFGHKRGAFTGAVADADGFVAQADQGTLFLDEVGELPADQQAKLLRVLENREYVPVGGTRVVRSTARVVAATNADLRSGGFRADLYARLAGTVIRLPPLRERRGDVLALAKSFLAEAEPRKLFTFSANAAEALVLHRWPHNVRELRTAMRRVALVLADGGEVTRRSLGDVLEAAPAEAPAAARRPTRGKAPDREELAARLTALRGNVNRLAEEYGKDPKQIYRWLRQHDLDPATFR